MLKESSNSLPQIAKAIGILLFATAFVVAMASVLVLALDYVLLVFLGVLLAIFLTKASQTANRYLPIGYSWNLALVTSFLLFALIGGFALLGNKIHGRLQATSDKLDEGTEQLVNRLSEYPLALAAFKRIPFAQQLIAEDQPQHDRSGKQVRSAQVVNSAQPSDSDKSTTDNSDRNSGSAFQGPSVALVESAAGKAFSILTNLFSTTLGLVANLGVILFVGIFIAVDPTLYRDGFARLFPLTRRSRVKEVLDKIGSTLFSWLLGRFMTMAITGSGTATALFALGVPMAGTVGVITGLLTFVPNIGGFLALFLAMLVALPQGLATVGWVVVLYAALQLLESNVITPLLQQHQTSIPPALLISVQALMGAIAGFLGLMVATPLLAATLVLVQQVWIEDVLGESQTSQQ